MNEERSVVLIIKDLLYSNFPEADEIQVDDLSGDGMHVSLFISSAKFKDKSRIDRHRMIYEILGDIVGKKIHSIAIQTEVAD